MIVTHRDMKRHMRYCNSGARKFFHRHGLDWSDFIRHGVPAEKLTATGDSMALRLVEKVRQEDES